MADSTLAALTAATTGTGGLFYGTQSGADRKFTLTAAGAALAEAADAAAQRTALAAPGLATANVFTANGAASTPPLSLTGTWFTGGSATTTKPQLLIEPTGATSNTWDTAGTGFGVNAPSGFTGQIISAKLNGAARFSVDYTGVATMPVLQVSNYGVIQNYLYVSGDDVAIANSGSVGNGGGVVYDSAAGPAWTSSGAWYGTQQTWLRQKAAASLQMGISSATPINQFFGACSGVGTNIVGGKMSIGPGQSTGNATPAVLALQGTEAGGSGTTAQTLVDVLTIPDATQVVVANGVAFQLGNAAAAESVSQTHTLLIRDSSGVQYKILVAEII